MKGSGSVTSGFRSTTLVDTVHNHLRCELNISGSHLISHRHIQGASGIDARFLKQI
jgi:hypothetical protein